MIARRGMTKTITIVPQNIWRLMVLWYESLFKTMARSLLSRKKQQYKFSRNGIRNMSKPPRMICQIRFGSHLYGTSTPTSDDDYKGIFLPEERDIILGRIPKTHREGECDDTRKNLPGELDCQYYSLHHFLRLATQGQTVAIDMLFAPDTMVYKDPTYGWVWDDLVSKRKLLLSKQMNAFVGYARGQAAKYSLKGERLNRLQDFAAYLDATDVEVNLQDLWTKLPKDDERTNPQGIRELQMAGKWFGETTAITTVRDSITKQLAAYGSRTHAAGEAGGVDWKALSHAVRVSKELLEILSFGEIQFPLRDADLILRVKQGKLALEEVQGIIDRDLAFVELQTKQSRLPESVDHVAWDDWLFETVKKTI